MRKFIREFGTVKFVIKVDEYHTIQEVVVIGPNGGDFFKLGKICSETKVLLSSCMPNRLDIFTQKRLAELTVKAYEYMDCTVDMDYVLLTYKEQKQ